MTTTQPKPHGHLHSLEERLAQSQKIQANANRANGVAPAEGQKYCKGCDSIKPLDEFPRRRSRGEQSVRARCKACTWRAGSTASKRWARENKERVEAKRLERTYGLKQDDYHELIAKQGGRCAICRRDAKLAVDHNHDSGRVRGLLCNPCNKGLGQFGDNLKLLLKAVRYLEEMDA